jgi:hypothetical protein
LLSAALLQNIQKAQFTKFRLGVIRWVHELFKRPSYLRMVELRTRIWTQDLPNTKQDFYPLHRNVRCTCYRHFRADFALFKNCSSCSKLVHDLKGSV